MQSELRADFPNKRIVVADASPDTEISRRLRYASVGPAPFDFFQGKPIEEVSECQVLIFQALGVEGEHTCLANLLQKHRPRFLLVMKEEKADLSDSHVLEKWHVNSIMLPDQPSLWLPVITAPQCFLYCQDSLLLGSCCSNAAKKFDEWSRAFGDRRDLLPYLLTPGAFSNAWIGPKTAHGVKRKSEDQEAAIAAKRQQYWDEAKSRQLLHDSYSPDTPIKGRIEHLGDRAVVIAHVLASRMSNALETTGRVMMIGSSSWPKSGSQYNMVPKKFGPGVIVASWPQTASSPNVRELLPAEILAMKGWSPCINMSTLLPASSFHVCRKLPFQPVIKTWLAATLQV
ncbi:unnamed protein product [Symbiodinium sp. CCMP2592]|nr:unnamed protein product [Symbiodinium sp. CCMP2592]